MVDTQQTSLPAVPASAARARDFVSEVTDLQPLEREDLEVIVSELVTNAIRHAGLSPGDALTLVISATGTSVRVEVHDGGPGFDPRLATTGGSVDGGFGLHIVDSLAARWDVDPRRGTVWAELDLPLR